MFRLTAKVIQRCVSYRPLRYTVAQTPVCLFSSSSRWFSQPSVAAQAMEEPSEATQTIEKATVSHTNLFASHDHIAVPLKKSLAKGFGYTEMSVVQEKVMASLPTNADLVVRAKTGTGKTLAFLLAALARLPTLEAQKDAISVLVIAPTRELAMQIKDEAQKLLYYTNMRPQAAIGGMPKQEQVYRIVSRPCGLLVATPGRLKDLIDSEPRLMAKLQKTQVLVLDEVDRLMDQGFYTDIQEICTHLPRDRQTLYFSATFNQETKDIIKETAKPGTKFLDCVDKNEVESHLQIKQSMFVLPFVQQLPFLYQTIAEHKAANPQARVLVFFPTAVLTEYCASVFNNLDDMHVLKLHSRLSQQERDRISARFRAATSATLFTTDVSARGVDYPNVSLVIQMGAAPGREIYIHRIGRTGRAGKTGEAMMVLAPFESRFIHEVKDMPIKEHPSMPEVPEKYKQAIVKSVQSLSENVRKSVFAPWFTYYRGQMTRLSITKDTWVKAGEKFARGVLGLSGIPSLSASLVREAKIAGYPGIAVSKQPRIAVDNLHGHANSAKGFKFLNKRSEHQA